MPPAFSIFISSHFLEYFRFSRLDMPLIEWTSCDRRELVASSAVSATKSLSQIRSRISVGDVLPFFLAKKYRFLKESYA